MQYSPSIERFLELSYDLVGRNRSEELVAALLEELRTISTSAGLDTSSSQILSAEEVFNAELWNVDRDGFPSSVKLAPSYIRIKLEVSET